MTKHYFDSLLQIIGTVDTYENGKLTLTPADEIKTEYTDGDVTVYVTTY